ncbi:unnamed protein product, partial [Owenia fusiformis]
DNLETHRFYFNRKRRRSSGLQTGHSRYKKRLKIAPTVTTSDAGCTKATTNDKSLKTPINANTKAIRSARKNAPKKRKKPKIRKTLFEQSHIHVARNRGQLQWAA